MSNQIEQALRNAKGCQFISFTAITEPKMNKKGNPFQNVKKVAKYSGVINANFEKSVSKAIGSEYKSKKVWHKLDSNQAGTALAENNGSSYVRFMPHRIKERYFCNGVEINKADILNFLVNKKKKGLKPDFICVNVKNVKEMKIRKLNLV